ncbi:MAG: flavocytochrome c [Alkalispirochaeta sp.]
MKKFLYMLVVSTLVVGTFFGCGGKETAEPAADVIVVGAGGAGLSAAVEVLKAGSTVLVIEKMPFVGGNTIRAGSAMNAPVTERQKKYPMSQSEMERVEEALALEPKDDLMKEWQTTLRKEFDQYKASGADHLFDSPALHKIHTYDGGDYVGDPEIIDTFGDNAVDAFNYLKDLGTDWTENVVAMIGTIWVRANKVAGGQGSEFVNPQVEYVEANGGQIITDSRVTELIVDAGRVVGVKGETATGSPFTYTARKGVVLTTGGFGANVEMRESYNTHWETLDAGIETTNHPGATGDGIVMAEAIGAQTVGMDWIQLLPMYYSSTAQLLIGNIEDVIMVNQDGNRFVKEDGRRDEVSAAELAQDKKGMFMLYTPALVETGEGRFEPTSLEKLKDNPYVFHGCSLPELAKDMGVPVENLEAAIAEYNEGRTTGEDKFGRSIYGQEFDPTSDALWATWTHPFVHHTMGGVKINPKAQVLDTDDKPIPGLFAAGEVTGGVHGTNRLGGNAITDIIVFGRIAGQSAAAE